VVESLAIKLARMLLELVEPSNFILGDLSDT
jgi:hypothetical protein